MNIKVEICAAGLASAINAQNAGAHRIELCEGLELGGLTPSFGTLKQVKNLVKLPAHVLIRPRRGDFIYDNHLIDLMCEDISLVKQLGYEGVVMGVLDGAGRLDTDRFKVLLEAAEGMSVTFHRAIDVAAEPFQILKQLIDFGVERVLSSGGKATALEGSAMLAAMVAQFGKHITIMAGSGINAQNVVCLVEETHVPEVHFSAKKLKSNFENDILHTQIVDGNEWFESDEANIRKLMQILNYKG